MPARQVGSSSGDSIPGSWEGGGQGVAGKGGKGVFLECVFVCLCVFVGGGGSRGGGGNCTGLAQGHDGWACSKVVLILEQFQ